MKQKKLEERTYYELGYCYLKGYGVEKNIRKARWYFKKAGSYAPALFQLGASYWELRKIWTWCGDSAQALIAKGYFESSAHLNYAKAFYILSYCYAFCLKARKDKPTDKEGRLGIIIMHKDIMQAKEWLIKASNSGYAKAQYRLGMEYYIGLDYQTFEFYAPIRIRLI